MNPMPDIPLSTLLQRAAQDLAAEPAPAMSPRIAAALPSAGAPRRPPTRRSGRPLGVSWPRPWAWAGATACLAVLCTAGLLMVNEPLPAVAQAAAPASDFLLLANGDAWRSLAPGDGEGAWLVRTEMPKYRLAALGLPYDPGRASESVRAELLLHASGEVLAVRLLR